MSPLDAAFIPHDAAAIGVYRADTGFTSVISTSRSEMFIAAGSIGCRAFTCADAFTPCQVSTSRRPGAITALRGQVADTGFTDIRRTSTAGLFIATIRFVALALLLAELTGRRYTETVPYQITAQGIDLANAGFTEGNRTSSTVGFCTAGCRGNDATLTFATVFTCVGPDGSAGLCPGSAATLRCDVANASLATNIPASGRVIGLAAGPLGGEAPATLITESHGCGIAIAVPGHITTGGFQFAYAGLARGVPATRCRPVFTTGIVCFGNVGAFTGILAGCFFIGTAPLSRTTFHAFLIPCQIAAVGQEVTYAIFTDIVCGTSNSPFRDVTTG